MRRGRRILENGNNTDHFIPYPMHSDVRHNWTLGQRELGYATMSYHEVLL